MAKKRRLIVKGLFWLLLLTSFIASASVLLLIAAGYKVNWQAQKIEKTGMILIESRPRQADVYINDRLITTETPLKAAQLLSGRYKLEVKEEDYFSWSVTFDLESGQAYDFRNIILFKEKAITEEPTEKDKSLLTNLKEEKDLAISDNELYRMENDFPILITRLSSEILTAHWFPGKKQVAFQSENKIIISDLDGRNDRVLAELPNNEKTSFTFVDDGDVLIATQKDLTYRWRIR